MNIKLIEIIQYVNEHGMLQFLNHVLERLGFVNWNRTLIFLVLKFNDLPNDMSEPYSFHVASMHDIKIEQDYYDSWFTKQEAVDRMQSGHRLFILKRNEKIVYFLWAELNRAAIKYFDMRFDIPNDMIYLTGAYTLPEFRGQGIASKLKKQIFHYLKKEGFIDMICVVDPLNPTALGIDKRLGFREYQTVIYKRYWHIRHYTVQKVNSSESKTFITLFKAPKNIWKTFLQIGLNP